ncbi:MAG: hypothetical protein GY835_21385 [bacterium]|nr:hypothetical protein [bacterium]
MKHSLLILSIALLCVTLFSPFAALAKKGNWVRYETWTADSLAAGGLYFPAPLGDEPAVLMLHSRGEAIKHYDLLAKRFQEKGSPVIIPSFRGEGFSTKSNKGTVPPAARWGQKERTILLNDLESALTFAAAQIGMEKREWIVVGSGESCAIAFELLARDSSFTRLICLAPLLQADFDMQLVKRPDRMFLVACDGDEEAMASLRKIEKTAPEWTTQVEVPGCRARGQSILRWQPAILERMVIWAGR